MSEASTPGMRLETERLRLRPTVPEDLEVAHRWYGDATTMQYITGRACTLEETEARLARAIGDHATYGMGLCLTALRATGEWVGHCGIKPHRVEKEVQGELAWMFAPPFWHRGLGREVASGLIDYAGGTLGLSRVIAMAHPDNVHSLTIMERLGMTRTESTPDLLTYHLVL